MLIKVKTGKRKSDRFVLVSSRNPSYWPQTNCGVTISAWEFLGHEVMSMRTRNLHVYKPMATNSREINFPTSKTGGDRQVPYFLCCWLNFSPSPPFGRWFPSRVSTFCRSLVPGLFLSWAQSLISCSCKAGPPAWREPRIANHIGLHCFLLIWAPFPPWFLEILIIFLPF